MPILERNRGLYPGDWPEIRQEVLERDGHRCKFCGVENYSDNPDTGVKVILTIAHLDHDPTNNGTPGKRPNLAALCQRCHNRHDALHRQETRRESKRLALEGAGQGDIFERGGSGEDNLGKSLLARERGLKHMKQEDRMDKKIVICKSLDGDEGLPPWGWGFALIALDIKPMPIGNKNKITRFGNGKSGISKNREAEGYVKRLRTIFHEAAGILALKDETFRKVKLPIDGKRCPLRVDVLYLFSPADNAHGQLARTDLDNLNKGTYDALKSGPTEIGFDWGLVSDDCYITEGFTCKGETPEEDPTPGSKVVIICSRSGIRTGEEMMALPRFLAPLPPYRIETQASPILRPRIIPGRN